MGLDPAPLEEIEDWAAGLQRFWASVSTLSTPSSPDAHVGAAMPLIPLLRGGRYERNRGDGQHQTRGARGKLPAGDAHVVAASRTYSAPIHDVWDALTNAERIPRWFLPVQGDLRLGGTYQFEGNAGGEIRECEPPRRLLVTWVMGEPGSEDSSVVEVVLDPMGDAETILTVEHTAVPPEM